MSTPHDDEGEARESSAQRKGKNRAVVRNFPHETTPLLPTTLVTHEDVRLNPTNLRHRLRSLLVVVFITTLSATSVLLISCYFFGRTISARLARYPIAAENLLVVRGPEQVRVLNVSSGHVWLQVDALVGVDVGSVLEDVLDYPVQRSIASWAIGKMGNVTAAVAGVEIFSSEANASLATIQVPNISLPLTASRRRDDDDTMWLVPVSVPILIQPTTNVSDITEFIQTSWKSGTVDLKALANSVSILGGLPGDQTWRSKVTFQKQSVVSKFSSPIPPLPGLPTPGKDTPFPSVSDFVSLVSFQLSYNAEEGSVHIDAKASIKNPLPESMSITTPYLSFIVSLPNCTDSLPVAYAKSDPVILTRPDTLIQLSGAVLPMPSSSPLLSSFLSTYLSATPPGPPIRIHSTAFPSLVIDTVFPAPKTRPELLHNVTIRNMHIKPSGGQVLASGTVYARVVLPKGVRVGLEVQKLWPDVLVFDGSLPEPGDGDEDGDIDGGKEEGRQSPTAGNWFASSQVENTMLFPSWPWKRKHRPGTPRPPSPPSQHHGSFPARPLPSPLPEHAFARIRTEDWITAQSTLLDPDPDRDEENAGYEYIVTASVVDVPLQVLPDREKEFSQFVGKVLFGSQGAVAGIEGVASITVDVRGLSTTTGGSLEVDDLPFRGNFRVGKMF